MSDIKALVPNTAFATNAGHANNTTRAPLATNMLYTDVKDAKAGDVKEAKAGDVKEAKAADVKDAKAADVKDAKAADVKDAKAADAKDAKENIAMGLDDVKSDASVNITLISSDLKRFTLSRKDAGISTLIKVSTDADAAADEIKLPSVTGSVLEHVVVYMRHHKGVEPPVIEKPLRSKIMSEVCPDKADAKFIDAIGELNKQPLYDLILAANYLDIKSLLHLGCAKVASLIKGQPLEKIKEILDPNTKKSDEKKSESPASLPLAVAAKK